MKFIANIVLLSVLLGCSSRHTPINSKNKSDLSKKTQEKTEAELDKESSVYPPIKDFPFEIKIVPILYIDEEQTELTRDKDYNPKTSVGGAYNILVTNKINHDIQVLGPVITDYPEFKNFSESEGIIQRGIIDTPLRGCISVQYPFSTRPDMEIMTDFYCWKNGEWKLVNLKLKQPT